MLDQVQRLLTVFKMVPITRLAHEVTKNLRIQNQVVDQTVKNYIYKIAACLLRGKKILTNDRDWL